MIAVVLSRGVAQAGNDETTFAQTFNVAADHVHGVVHHELPGGGDSKTALELVATEQRELDDRHSHCLRPKPTEIRYTLEERHDRAVGLPVRTGCQVSACP